MAKIKTYTKKELLKLKRHWFDLGCYHVARFGLGFDGGDSESDDPREVSVRQLHDGAFKRCLVLERSDDLFELKKKKS